MEIVVQHDRRRERFFVNVEGHEAYLDYSTLDERTVDYRHTFTPPELRGRGIAKVIVRDALDWANAEGKKVVPTCSYVRRVIEAEKAK